MSIIFGPLTSFSGILEGRWDRMIHEHNSFAVTRNSPNFLHVTDKTFIRRVDLLFRCVCLNLSSQHIYISFQLVSSDIWTRKDDEYLSISATICLVHLFLRACAGVSLWFAGEHRESRFLRVSQKGQSHQSAEGQELKSRAAFCHPYLSDGSCSLL